MAKYTISAVVEISLDFDIETDDLADMGIDVEDPADPDEIHDAFTSFIEDGEPLVELMNEGFSVGKTTITVEPVKEKAKK